MLDAAITFEDDYKNVQEDRRKRAKKETKRIQASKPKPNLEFKPRNNPYNNNNSNRSVNPNAKNIICHNCKLPGHISRDCPKPLIVCHACGQRGHIKPNCPSKPQGGWPARDGRQASGGNGHPNKGVNNGKNNNGKRNRPTEKLKCATLEEVDNLEHAVIGTLNILTNPGKVIFDTGATTSFIYEEFCDKFGIRRATLENPMIVVTTEGNVIVRHIKQDQVISIYGCTYFADLYVIPLKGIAVVLGMDWLMDVTPSE